MATALRVALVQFIPRKGPHTANLSRFGAALAELDRLEPRPHVVQLAETALTGYFVEGGARDVATTAGTLARDLDAAFRAAVAAPRAIDVVVGFYERWHNNLYNSAMYVTLGDPDAPEPRIRHVHRKNFLPTYGLFDEERFVERGHDVRAFDTSWGRAALLICEDAWHSMTGALAALDGAQVVFVCAAAPARGAWPRDDAAGGPASVWRWERLARDIAEEHGVFVTLVNLVGQEGGKAFFGRSLVAGPHGDVRARAPLWDEGIVSLPLDLDDLSRARADMPLLSDLRTALPHLRANLDAIERGPSWPVPFDAATGDRDAAAVRPEQGNAGSAVGDGGTLPIASLEARHQTVVAPLAIDGPVLEGWLVRFLRQELARRGFAKAVVGLSGGVDSAVTALLAARALGAENVTAVRLPYRTSSPESLAHAQLVIDAAGLASRTIDISAAVDGYLAQEPDADRTRRGNVMARVRMIALFDLSAKLRALPLGTGNKTERLLGYFTWHADDSPPVNPLGDLFKTQVWAMARHLGVPGAIIDKAPTADLVAGQTDEGDLGISYGRADEILNWLLSGYEPAELISRGMAAAEVELVRKRLADTHWKRRLPTVAMISGTAIGESYLRPVDY